MTPRFRARQTRRIPGTMNKLEAAYHERLTRLQATGEVAWFGYEAIRIKLAPLTTWLPDFAVLLPTGELQLHEVKGGFWMDDARVKVKLAAEMYPFFTVIAVTRPRKSEDWKFEEF